jgi:Rieske Fe-S protein
VTVTTENGVIIKAKNLVVATQYPFYDGKSFFFTKLYGKRGYAAAAVPEKDFPDGSFKKSDEPTRSLRKCYQNDGCVAIAQGETHYTGRSDDMESHYSEILKFLNDEVGIKKEVAKWSAQDYDTPDGIAYIGRLNKKSHVYVETGYGRWGMSNGTLAGMIISDMIAAGGNRFEELFSPMRKEKVSPAVNMAGKVSASVGELLKSKTEKPQTVLEICPGEGRVTVFNGQKAGIFVDENNNAVVLDIKCAHLGTVLNFNSAEKTWDCPAHASRYTCDGKVLEGVAKKPLGVLFKGKLSELKLSDEGNIVFEESK